MPGCSKKAVPAKVGEIVPVNIDFAAFDRLYSEGLRLKLMGDAGEALRYFEQCLKLNPENDAVHYQMAQILASAGNAVAARKYALNAVKYDDKNVWYLMMLSQLYYQSKNIDSAIIWYEKASNLFPENENLQLTLGNLYVEKGDLAKAGSIFDSFDMKYGVNDASTLTSIRILMSSGKYDTAESKVRELLKTRPDDIVYNGLLAEILDSRGDKQQAEEVYKKLLILAPDEPQILLSYAGFLAGEKRMDELFSILNAIAVNDKISREDKISLFAELGQMPELIMDKENRLIKTLMVLEVKYQKDDIIPLIRTDLLIKQGKGEAAIKRLEELIKLNPGSYFAWEKLLFAYLDAGNFEMLRVRGEECATRFNTSFLIKILYANGAIETGKYETALSELDKARILAGGDATNLIQVLSMQADVYYRTKDYEKAFATFEDALKYNKDDLTILNNYAYYLAEQDTRLKDAEIYARRVIESEKNNSTFLDTYGWVLYKRGKLGDAAKVFETIINSGEAPDAEWFEHYGYILKKQRKCEKAIENWKISIKLDPTKEHLLKEIENCKK